MKEVITMRNELLKGLSEEQIKKVEACKSPEEIIALAKAEGVELTDEQLAAVSGGGLCVSNKHCPKCGSKNVEKIPSQRHTNYDDFKCYDCDHRWRFHYA